MDYISAHFASADAVEHVRIKVSKQRTFSRGNVSRKERIHQKKKPAEEN